ncbi:MAG: RelA/SpoT family protein [Burkholderiaceae bacterium]
MQASASTLISPLESPPGTGTHLVQQARAFAQPLIAAEQLPTGENTLAHADALVQLLADMGGASDLQAACYLAYAGEHLQRPLEVLTKLYGAPLAALAHETLQLVQLQRQTRQHAGKKNESSLAGNPQGTAQAETVRKMLLAFSRDLRVVMLYLASRVQTLRYFAAAKKTAPPEVAHECLQVLAPLANRLGIWQIKWELEDLAFRFLEPEHYRQIAALLDEKRGEREAHVEQLRRNLELELKTQGIAAAVTGRPKHIYSIARKMRGKSLGFAQVLDILGLRVVVQDVPACYAVLAWVHAQFVPVAHEFDDYIAKPKANGYQSLHTVVREKADTATGHGKAVEIQIRTQAMHDRAEYGVAAHWAYKEAGIKGYAGTSAVGAHDARMAVLRQLLAWQSDVSADPSDPAGLQVAAAEGAFDARIYVLTPEAGVVELPRGASPVDFAYAVHSSLGHRCRGARVDGVMVPLNTPLQNGQTVEVIAAKEGAPNTGPSRDWLNPELGYLTTGRAKSRVRAWFNALAAQETTDRGREAVDKLLQRLGKTAVKLSDLAAQLGFASPDALFMLVGKDEFSLRTIETLWKPAEPAPDADALVLQKTARHADKSAGSGAGGVLVVGVDSLLTQLARCCKPAPPDAIGGFVTRGKGVSIHRQACSNFCALQLREPGRIIEVQWGQGGDEAAQYGVDVAVQAQDRQGLLRDISELFAKEKMNVTRVQTESVKDQAFMTFTVQVTGTARLAQALAGVLQVPGVRSARRR